MFAGFLEHTDDADRAVREGARGHRRVGQHAVHLHRRRQRHERRGRLRRHVQRDDLFQRRDREGGGPHPVDRQVGRPGDLPAHVRRLGGGVRHALHVDQAGGVRLRRHAQRHGHPLAEGHPGAGRPAHSVLARHRHRPDDPGGRRPAGAQERQRHGADAHRGHQPALRLQRREGAGAAHDAVLRDVRQSRDLPRRLVCPNHPPCAVADEQPAAADDRRLGTLRREE